jgi:uncharacterized membrane protein
LVGVGEGVPVIVDVTVAVEPGPVTVTVGAGPVTVSVGQAVGSTVLVVVVVDVVEVVVVVVVVVVLGVHLPQETSQRPNM